MLRIVSIILREQLKYFFRKERLWLRLLLAVGGFLLWSVYSAGMAFLLDKVGDSISEEIGISVPEMVLAIVGGLGVLTIFGHFFPTYHPKKVWIPKVFPMSKIKRFVTETTIDSLGLLYIGNMLFFVPAFIVADLFTWDLMVLVVVYTWLILLTLRAFQTFFQDAIKWSKPAAYLGVILLVLAGGSVVPTVTHYEIFWWMPFVTFALAFAGSYSVELAIVGKKEEQAKMGSLSYSFDKMARDLLWNSKPIRTGMLMSFAFKIVLLALVASEVLLKSESNSFLHYYFLFFVLPPLSIFTYVFNNVFGYLRNSWLTIQKTTGNYKDFKALYRSLFMVPVLVDFAISFVFVIYAKVDLVFFFGMYVGSTILNYYGGLFWSIYFPKPVLKALNMSGGNSSPMGSFFVMGITGLLFTIQFSYWFLLLIPIYILGAFILNKIMADDYQNKQYNIYDKLFKAQ